MKHLASTLLLSLLLGACGGDDTAMSLPDAPVGAQPDAPPQDLDLEVGSEQLKAPILQGTDGEIEVRATRRNGLTGAVTVTLDGLPPGVTVDPLTIGADETTGTLVIHAAANAPHSLPTRVFILGHLGTHASSSTIDMTVYGPPGSLDTSFKGGTVMMGPGAGDDYANALAVQNDGKLLLAGSSAEHLGDFAIVRLDRDGALDPTFGSNGTVLTDFAGAADKISAIALQPDGKIIAVGTTVGATTKTDFALARYNTDGSLDTTFGTGGKVVTSLGADADTAYAVLITVDGKIVVGGDSSRGTNNGGLDFALVRYTSTGALDGSFGTGGVTLTPVRAGDSRDSIYALAFQPLDGEQRILAVGGEGDFTAVRYRSNGTLDTAFGTNGKVMAPFGSTIGAAYAVGLTPDGELLLAGHSQNQFALLQLDDTGAPDPFFGTQGKVITQINTTNWNAARAITFDLLGKPVVAGWTYDGGSSAGNFVVARYLATGDLDPTFAETGLVITKVAPGVKADESRAVLLQADERVPTHRIVVAGSASNSNSDFAVARYWR